MPTVLASGRILVWVIWFIQHYCYVSGCIVAWWVCSQRDPSSYLYPSLTHCIHLPSLALGAFMFSSVKWG